MWDLCGMCTLRDPLSVGGYHFISELPFLQPSKNIRNVDPPSHFGTPPPTFCELIGNHKIFIKYRENKAPKLFLALLALGARGGPSRGGWVGWPAKMARRRRIIILAKKKYFLSRASQAAWQQPIHPASQVVRAELPGQRLFG